MNTVFQKIFRGKTSDTSVTEFESFVTRRFNDIKKSMELLSCMDNNMTWNGYLVYLYDMSQKLGMSNVEYFIDYNLKRLEKKKTCVLLKDKKGRIIGKFPIIPPREIDGFKFNKTMSPIYDATKVKSEIDNVTIDGDDTLSIYIKDDRIILKHNDYGNVDVRYSFLDDCIEIDPYQFLSMTDFLDVVLETHKSNSRA